MRFQDRTDAGRALGERLQRYAGRDDVVVLGLPRGGVPVAAEVAEAIDAPLDVFLVRKLGTPGHEELAMGAVSTGGVRVLNKDVVSGMAIPESVIERVAEREREEIRRREERYRGDRPPPDLEGAVAILVDDGLATGATMRAAIEAARQMEPARLVVAVPLAPAETCRELESVVDEVVCLQSPEPFLAVGAWYVDFDQTTDEEVRELLAEASSRKEAGG